MIARLSHNHPSFKDDNASVFADIEAAVRGSRYASVIVPHAKKKDGRKALKALLSAHANQGVWDAEIKKQEDILNNRKWTGGTNITLEKHVDLHRTAHIALEQAAVHVTYQIPTEFT